MVTSDPVITGVLWSVDRTCSGAQQLAIWGTGI